MAFVVSQCNKSRSTKSYESQQLWKALRSINENFEKTPEQLADLGLKLPCRNCRDLSHWESDHKPDGAIHVFGRISNSTVASSFDARTKETVTFPMVSFPTSIFKVPAGPLLDDGAPYSWEGLANYTDPTFSCSRCAWYTRLATWMDPSSFLVAICSRRES